MEDKLVMRSNAQIFEDIVVTGLKEHASREDMRLALIDAFRKEIFGQMMFRMKVDDLRDAPKTPKNEEIVTKITLQAMKKWRGMVKECNKWTQTVNMISEDDLDHIWDDDEEETEDDGYEFAEAEDPEEEEEIDEMTAEWPELSEEEPKLPEIGQEFPPGYWTK